MPRELRQRTSRLNYAALFQYDDDGAGPSGSNMQAHFEDNAESGSDFVPAPEGEQPVEESEEDELGDNDGEDDEKTGAIEPSDEEGSIVIAQTDPKGQRKTSKRRVSLAPGISVRQQSTASSLPSAHHRHRPISLHKRPKSSRAERLACRPSPFKSPPLIPTQAFSEPLIDTRVPKSWSYNVGPGPFWELMEDRGFYNEAPYNEDEREGIRRPTVHQTIQMKPGAFEELTGEQAAAFLPKGQIKCSFGRYSEQEQLAIKPLDTLRMDKYFPENISHVFSAGGPVWALDWCPISPDGREAIQRRQYLAIGPLPSHDYAPLIGVKRSTSACIQIWSLNPTPPPKDDLGFMRCDIVLCTGAGPAYELKWCPLPSHDSLQPLDSPLRTPRKMGLLAGTFEDGSMCIYAIPYPPDISRGTVKDSGPVCVKLSEPLLRIHFEETLCWCLDWANSEVLAVGCTNGTIAVYNVVDSLNSDAPLPSHFFSAHQSAIRSLTWIRAPTYSANAEVTSDSPTMIISVGYDGVMHAIDLREPCGSDISRTRDAINAICFSTYCGGPICVDQGFLKAISISPIFLNKGHTILDPEGPVWDVSASDYHPQVAAAVADGSVVTANTMRFTRRGGTVPFLAHKIYQMDYSRKTGEYRMLEHFKPKEVPRVGGASREPTKASGAWSPEVGVTRVAWNQGNGLASASWLASATASGLCRVDWLTGRWLHDKIPYHSIEGIRGEVEVEEEEDYE
ncbi:uncharacterized protein PHACADRAFT_161079 [Phanerochaete carnosa HHB-10118-sp]|uniref:Uncharacterized protein n=1 Tax=Phanerochaete carnosa (strain HHB-10118-sp) TaxID=650164 RepID=K5WXA0_PHACS|nr:uncharacterized protein PHACADRAFT_161079 [Phanerochaete carnosa HHB-10118-sp]EKM55117.1 hypothetical protein PHACADRAFT_161079 [Phanerochaete carnosa HHB-10118-sp]